MLWIKLLKFNFAVCRGDDFYWRTLIKEQIAFVCSVSVYFQLIFVQVFYDSLTNERKDGEQSVMLSFSVNENQTVLISSEKPWSIFVERNSVYYLIFFGMCAVVYDKIHGYCRVVLLTKRNHRQTIGTDGFGQHSLCINVDRKQKENKCKYAVHIFWVLR